MTDILPNLTVDSWADRIRPHLAGAMESILAAGRELIDAKAALPHGEFGPLLEQLGLSHGHAARFMRVADHPVLAKLSPATGLPASVTVLDELTRIPEDELVDAIDRGDIGPTTTRREAVDLAAQHRTPSVPQPTEDEPYNPGEQDAILDTLHDEHGDDLTADHIEQAVDENIESKQVPEPRPEWQPTKPDIGAGATSHPARYSPELIPLFADLLATYSHPGARVLDPFAGTGRIHKLVEDGYDTIGIEIEKEWADLHERTQLGSALDLPFDLATFDAIITSPTYGNRLADSHNATDPERRRSYTHDLGRDLHEDNSGALHWRNGASGSEAYRTFHEKAWDEAVLVLKPGGLFVLNMCDHVRDGFVQPVTAWHCWILGRLGLDYVESRTVPTRKLRQGANSNLREQEYLYVFRKPS